MREPELGDKLGSRFGQKGVVGMLIPAVDMPFTEGGVVPDIILNPHAFPKRMTISHIMESVLSLAGVSSGTRYNADTFGGLDVMGEATSVLEAHGMERFADEIMYNGRTGEQMDVRVFTGINYYGRLKHMVEDKYQFRSTGAVDTVSRQPVKTASGASGGLRLGEMEQNALLAHGLGSFLKESFMDRSDRYISEFDTDTGKRSGWWARTDGDVEVPSNSAIVETPYTFKLLQQELQTMGIDSRLVFEDPHDPFLESNGDRCVKNVPNAENIEIIKEAYNAEERTKESPSLVKNIDDLPNASKASNAGKPEKEVKVKAGKVVKAVTTGKEVKAVKEVKVKAGKGVNLVTTGDV
jgi:DNA-directed RNA polymerase beta subunit